METLPDFSAGAGGEVGGGLVVGGRNGEGKGDGVEGIALVFAEDFVDEGEVFVEGGGFGVLEPVFPGEWVAFELPAGEVEVDGGLEVAVADGGSGGVGDVGGGGGVGVFVRLADESGGEGIAFDVEHGGAVVARGLDALDAEAILPEVAVALLGAVDPAGMVGLELLHEAGDAVGAGGFEEEMDVIGHEAEGVDADGVAFGEEAESLEVGDELDFGEEDLLAVVAALVDVVDLAALPVAAAGGGFALFLAHIDKCVLAGKILTYFEGILQFLPSSAWSRT